MRNPRRPEDAFWRLGQALSLASLLVGCQVSAQASGSVKAGSDVSGDASGNASYSAEASTETTQPEPPPQNLQRPVIEFRQGRLEYKGVINFEYDKARLRDEAKTNETLAEFKTYLQEHDQVSLEIEGHTDSRGSDEYNMDLSQRRAEAVRTWLIQQGIAGERLTAIGKGESDPQVAEPDGCRNQHPEDTTPCEAAWATNRRVVFEVTGGGDTLPEPEAEPPPPPPPPVVEAAPEPEPAPAAPNKRFCPFLAGGRLDGLGPGSYVLVEAAIQPRICWLELSLGVGYKAARFSTDAAGPNADGHYSAFSIPLRGRFWFMERGHSLIADLGLGFLHYRMSATSADGAGGRYDYERNVTPFVSSLGVGYGWRPEGAQPGYRFGVLLGGLFHPTRMGSSNSSVENNFDGGTADALDTALDDRTENFSDASLYGEVSLGLLF